MTQIRRDERGVALVVAIIALVLVGALVAGAILVGHQDQRISGNIGLSQQSFSVAEGGAYEALRAWNFAAMKAKPVYPGDSTQINGQSWTTMANNTGSYGGYIYRLNNDLFLIDAIGRDSISRRGARYGGARQRVSVVVRIKAVEIPVDAAFTFGDRPIFGGGNVSADGNDHLPNATWGGSCPPLDSPKAGLITPVATDLQNGSNQYQGSPAMQYDPTAADSMRYAMFGSTSYADLAAMANVTIGPGTYAPAPVLNSGACNAGVATNWGDGLNRANPCGGYMPIIHETGNLTLSGGQGQGILLVDGDLTFSGGGTFFGAIIVRGQLKSTSGQLPQIYGVVLAQHASVWSPSASGNLNMYYSKCALDEVARANGTMTMLRSRGWVQAY